MLSLPVEEAAMKLPELVGLMQGNEEIILMQGDNPIAKIVLLATVRPKRRRGTAKHIITYIADDFDETPEGFEEYMP